ncbi:MAG: hypothetical protein ACOVSW_08835 [Candidatus Kapaibacteriota bacterium]
MMFSTLKRAALVGVSAFALATTSLSAQTVDEIITKINDAAGGEKTQRAVKSQEMQMEMTQSGSAMKIPVKVIVQRPSFAYTEGTVMGMTFKDGYDGKSGWQITPWTGQMDPAPKNEEELKESEERADIDGEFIDSKVKGYKIELMGKEDLEGEQAFKLKITNRHGDVKYRFFSAESYLPIKTVSKTKNKEGGESETEAYFSDFKKLPNGLIFPHTLDTKVKGQTVQTMVVKSVVFDKIYDAGFFAAPPAKKADAKAETKK